MTQVYHIAVTTPPDREPLSLVDAKDHLRESDDGQDELILSLITSARELVETETRRTVPVTSYVMTMDMFPDFDDPILIPKPPLREVSSITYIDTNGDEQTLDSDTYRVDTQTTPGRVILRSGQWPATGSNYASVKVNFEAGYDTPPASALTGIKLILGGLYENRQSIMDVQKYEIPMGVRYVLAPLLYGSYP